MKDEQTHRIFLESLKIPVKPKHLSVGGGDIDVAWRQPHFLQPLIHTRMLTRLLRVSHEEQRGSGCISVHGSEKAPVIV